MTPPDRYPRRAVARAVLWVWFFRIAASFALSYPTARIASAFIPAAFPDGDAALFAPGGLYAVEAVRLGGRALQASLEGSAFVFVLLAVAGCFPLAVALAGFIHPSETSPSLVHRAAAAMPSLLALGGLAAFLQATGIAVVVAGIAGLAGAFEPPLDERASDLCLCLVAFVATLPIVALGLVHDLARAAVIRHETRAAGAAAIALRVLRKMPGTVVARWLVPTAGIAAIVAAAALAAGALDVSRPGAARVASVFLVHQATVFAAVVLRLAWLGDALRLVGPPLPRPPVQDPVLSEPEPFSLGGTPARSDVPVDPTPGLDA